MPRSTISDPRDRGTAFDRHEDEAWARAGRRIGDALVLLVIALLALPVVRYAVSPQRAHLLASNEYPSVSDRMQKPGAARQIRFDPQK